MSSVFVVDSKAEGLTTDWNRISAKEGMGISLTAFETPEAMFMFAAEHSPDLVLLHHHWKGATIGTLLGRLSQISGVRAVVFTGQKVDLGEVIQCVRHGAADYWPDRGRMDPVEALRKLAHYCSSEAWTMATLSRPSEPTLQLLAQVEALRAKESELSVRASELETELGKALDGTVADQLATKSQWITQVVVAFCLTAVFLIVNNYALQKAALAVTAIVAACVLLLDRKIKQISVSILSMLRASVSASDDPKA